MNDIGKTKPHINMTTKGSFHKQIIIPIESNNINQFIMFSSKHVANLNCSLNSIKFDTIVDFIYIDY